MKPEDVPEEYLDALISQLPYQVAAAIEEIDFRAAIAAVAPLIAAAEREACAKVADATAGMEAYRTGRQYEDPEYLAKCDAKEEVANDIAAAIRARSDAP